jgi:pyruvate formate lyase activating enzyme
LGACPKGALGGDNYPALDHSICRDCRDYSCRQVCPTGALVIYGQRVRAEEIIKFAQKEEVFYNRSGGGLTVSGGEPLGQPDFLLALLKMAKIRRLKTALETTGLADYSILEAAAGFLDSVLYDVKIIDRRKHELFTGTENDLILANLQYLAKVHPNLDIVVRTPVVPGFNDNIAEAMELGRFLAGIPNVKFEALPYHRFGQSKYNFLSRPYPMGQLTLSEEALSSFEEAVKKGRLGEVGKQGALKHF